MGSLGLPLSCWKERRFRRSPAPRAGRHAIEIANLFPQLCPLGVGLLGFFPWPLPSTFSLWLKTGSCAFVQPPGLCPSITVPVPGDYGGVREGEGLLHWPRVWATRPLPAGTWHISFFLHHLENWRRGGDGKGCGCPRDGFGEMWTLIPVEERALLCQHKPGEM